MQQAHIAVVNESYPSDCIRFRSALSTLQVRFRVEGDPVATGKPVSTVVPESVPADSLPLKPSRRARQTSPETSQSTGETVPIEPFAPTLVVSETEDGGNGRERDLLDEVIDEAKAVSHLVSNFLYPLDSVYLLTLNSPSIHWIQPTRNPVPKKPMVRRLIKRTRPRRNKESRLGKTNLGNHGRRVSPACKSLTRTQNVIAPTAEPSRSCSKCWITIHAPPINGARWPIVGRSLHYANSLKRS